MGGWVIWEEIGIPFWAIRERTRQFDCMTKGCNSVVLVFKDDQGGPDEACDKCGKNEWRQAEPLERL